MNKNEAFYSNSMPYKNTIYLNMNFTVAIWPLYTSQSARYIKQIKIETNSFLLWQVVNSSV